jgi:hypothetical protein
MFVGTVVQEFYQPKNSIWVEIDENPSHDCDFTSLQKDSDEIHFLQPYLR